MLTIWRIEVGHQCRICLGQIPPISPSHLKTPLEEEEKYSEDFSIPNSHRDLGKIDMDYGIETQPKAIIYSKKKQSINHSIVYTICKEEENPPEINDLFTLKVKVPKVKVSKYFKDKYSPLRTNASIVKLNDSTFMSNKSTAEGSPLEQDYNYEYFKSLITVLVDLVLQKVRKALHMVDLTSVQVLMAVSTLK